MAPIKFPEGSGITNNRMESACVRAIDAYMTLGRRADALCAELDNVTLPGVVRAVIDDNDSLVTAVAEACEVMPTHVVHLPPKKPQMGG